MKTCKNYETYFEKLISKNISDQEHEELKSHVESCSNCSHLYKTNYNLSQIDNPIEKAKDEDFTNLRLKIIDKIGKQKDKSLSTKIQNIINTLVNYSKKPEYAIAAITLIVGFFLGRALPPDENGLTGGILKQISAIAEENIYLSDSEKSSYRFSNVSLKELKNNSISMSFDVSTSLNIVRDKNDPLVKEVLTQTMMAPENIGSKLRAISYSESIVDNKIKQALIYSMHYAPMTSVKLKSMEGLMKYKLDQEIQDAFLKVLNEEKSVKLNLMAIDYLTKNNFNEDSLKAIIEKSDPLKSTAIFIRAKKQKQLQSNP